MRSANAETARTEESVGTGKAAELYARMALRQAPRLLSCMDRQPHSVTFGSMDRDHWSWKFRDFPLGMLQVATYPLALLWAGDFPDNPYHRSTRVLEWIDGAIAQTLSRQRRNGAFDAFAPNEQDIGPTLGVTHGLLETARVLGDALAPERRRQLTEAVRRAADFALPLDETHAFISNHQALFAVAFLGAHDLTGDARYRARADAIVRTIIDRQSADGWYDEYGGADPGYESLGILHLATYWERTGSAELLASLWRSIDFISHFVHPDGGLGGVYGSRHTSLYFPAGFEILAPEIPLAGSIAAFMRARLERANVVTPDVTDVENLPALMYGYLEAARAAADSSRAELPPLPCEALDGMRNFEHARLIVVGSDRYYGIVNAGRGGPCRIFERSGGRLIYGDAGYVVTDGRTRWASQLAPSAEVAVDVEARVAECTVAFGEVRQAVLTPGSFVLLRVLNQTLFRSRSLGNLLRRLIVRRLITDRRAGPLRLARRISFDEDAIRFEDRITAARHVAVRDVALPRAFTALHMGSANYFQGSDLEQAFEVPVSDLADQLTKTGTASRTFVLRFDTPVRLELADEPVR